jgi:hypothetical protein
MKKKKIKDIYLKPPEQNDLLNLFNTDKSYFFTPPSPPKPNMANLTMANPK